MAGSKIAALLMCIVLVAAVQLHQTEAFGEYSACFKDCHKQCEGEGNGNTFCEMKCDGDCVAKETAAKLGVQQ